MCRKPKTAFLDTLEITSDSRAKNSSELYQARRKSKAITRAINGKLLYTNSVIHKDYQNAYYCNEYLFQDGSKIIANYCRKRSCLVCSRIYAARLMKAYVKPLLELKNLQLVTLTAPNVPGDQLRSEIDLMYSAYAKIKDNIRKTYKIKLRGFRKLEITFNHRTKKYNPHYHILVEGKRAANLVRKLWLDQFTKANDDGQDVRPITSVKGLLEVFKYVTKAIVKDTFDPMALDHMYVSIKGLRVYQSMGIKKEVEVKIKKYESTVITHRAERVDVWKWCNEKYDWYTSEGESFNDGDLVKDAKGIITIIEKAKNVHDKPKEQYQDFNQVAANQRKKTGRPITYFDD